ncbi:amino acid adenylation domain-containing protein [Variovorax sp. GB1R11]|uniref:amino acid adenylation domain-containing protein n=1 Tax=Variovorax sp. GB1R11 TaxID=3443741 RepID=UPI003F45972C
MPDIQDLSARRANLSAEQRARLQQRLRGAGTGARQAGSAISPRPERDRDRAPLSFAQRRQWFLWKLDPARTAYHLSGGLVLTGPLDTKALRASLQALVDRHESLRTVFREEGDGGAVQIIQQGLTVELPRIDLSALDTAAREQGVRAEVRRIRTEPFDLTRGPLMRAVLLRTGEQTHQLLVVMHHIVSDGWSVQLSLDELAAQYAARVQGRSPALAALPVQYADYAVWQNQWLDGGEGERQLAWWRDHLGTEQPVISLHTDRPRNADGRYGSARITAALPADTVARLRQQARGQGATLFMALLAGFNALLFRHTGQTDARVGVPIANRNRAETAGVVGFFVNTQVLRSRMGARTTLAELLVQTRDTAIGAQTHQDLPFEQLVGALRPERSLSANPLFQVMFNHVRRDHRSLAGWPGVSVERLDFEEEDAQFELTLQTLEFEDGRIEVTFLYAAELFDRETIERMAGHYLAVLGALAVEPEVAVGDVVLMGAAEREQLAAWGENHRRHEGAQPVHRQIEAHAKLQPSAPALVFGDEALSYAELNARANRLAHRLVALGVGPDVLVGICVERSTEMMVGILAVLKAGGAYVPLDPDYPADRLSYMVEDSGISLLLTQSGLRSLIPGAEALEVLELDTLDTSSEPDANPQVNLHGEHLAYVIYTSGSTGRPKGAAIRHQALFSCMAWMQEFYTLEGADTVLHKAPFGFDVSVWEMFWPLTSGARLVIANPGDHRDPARLVELIQKHQITTLNFVPSMLQAFLAYEGIEATTRLKHIICGGEAMPAATQKEALQRLSGATLQNLYGPTETTIHVTQWTCRDDGSTQVPIGRPISDTQAYVLDESLNEVPAGVAGELYLGGINLARGYLKRAGLTAERFVATANGQRLYRTGDLVRWNNAGQLEYLGRIDHQVKVRGFRIELGEIEAQLQAQPEVREAVVVASEGPSGARLVAYVSGNDIDTATLRERLAETLPDYMVPSVIMVLDALPLNANGKVDRKALPAPEFTSDRAYEAPEGEVEQALATIWAEVLGVPRVGRTDNFFELGGDSILSLKVTARAARAGVHLTPRQMFEHQSVARIAHALQAGRPAETQAIPVLDAAQRAGRLALSHAQMRQWFLWQLDPSSTAYHISGALKLVGRLDAAAVRASFDALVQRHASLRTVFRADAQGLAEQVVQEAGPLELATVDLAAWRTEAEREVRSREEALRLSHTPFDLAAGPLLRVGLIRLATDEHLLVVVMHHIVSDGWSMQVLVDEFVAHYRAHVQGAAVVLPPLPIQYTDYAAWQRDWLEAGERDRQLAYWTHHIGTGQPVLQLPTDHARKADGRYSAARHGFELPGDLVQRLQRRLQGQGATLFMGLLAGFQVLLSRYTGEPDIRVGVPVANRHRAETEGVIGFFVNTQVLRNVLDGRESLARVLARAKDAALGAQAHQDLPFEQLVEALQPERSLGASPLFQVMFNHQRGGLKALHRLPGLTLTECDLDAQAAQFELTLETSEGDDGRVTASLRYAAELFAPQTIARMAGHYLAVLAALADCPAQAVGDVVLLAHAERAQLAAWGAPVQAAGAAGATAAAGTAQPIHRLIERQAQARPDAVALVFGAQTLGYGELNAQANRLAHRLIALGVRPETRVGLAVERSLEMVVGILAILKAGGAYVPLDPDYPADRLAFMVADSGIALLLTQAHLQAPAIGALQVLSLDTLDLSAEPVANPEVGLHADSLAYVIYTSGSTGRPKGAQLCHRNVSRLLGATDAWFGFGPDDVWTLFHSYAFDFSVWEIFGALCTGGKLVIVPFWVSRSPEDFLQLLRTQRVTVLNQTPSAFGQLAGLPQSHEGGLALRAVIFGGEALDPQRLRGWIERHGDDSPRLFNMYGITETTVHVTFRRITAADLVQARSPVGIAIPDLGLRVLDGQLNPMPLGIAGELYVSGAGLARGYLNRAGLTAERFIAAEDGARLYRTGDLVKWNQEGQLEYLGRIDHQVKVRGFRIELGDIEAALLAQPEVREAVALASEGPGGTRLVGYVTAQGGRAIDAAALRERLGELLPEHMVPAVLVVLGALPLTPNGKVDRKALPAPEFLPGNAYEAPRGETEEQLAAVWAEVLGVARVGRDDNFFELGGHSLLSTRLVARLHAAMPGGLTVRDVFQYPTLAAMAERMAAALRDSPAAQALSEIDSLLDSMETA